LFVARNAAAEVAVIEKARIATDALAAQRAALEKLGVITGHGLTSHSAKGGLHGAKQDRHIRYAPRHGTCGVLLMTDRNDSVLRNQAERRFQPENVFDRGRSSDGTIRFSSYCRGA